MRSARALGVGLVLLLATVLAWPPRAAAQPRKQTEAATRFERGKVHYQLSEYRQALEQFREAYRLSQDPALLYNIAQCHRQLGEPRDALTFYRRYLAAEKDIPNRAEVERRIKELEAQVESPSAGAGPGRRADPTAPGPAAAAPDRGAEPPAEARGPAGLPARSPPGSPVVTVATEPAPPARAQSPVYTRWWFWTAVGAVVAGAAATGLILGGRGDGDRCLGFSECYVAR